MDSNWGTVALAHLSAPFPSPVRAGMRPCDTSEPLPARDSRSRAPAGWPPLPTLRRAPPQPPSRGVAPIPPPHCSTPMPPLRSSDCRRAQVFPPRALFSSAKELRATPVLPLCISSIAGRRRAIVAPESREAPLPTAPFSVLRPRRLLFLGWPAPHFPLTPLVL
jgi:hypothetical protein